MVKEDNTRSLPDAQPQFLSEGCFFGRRRRQNQSGFREGPRDSVLSIVFAFETDLHPLTESWRRLRGRKKNTPRYGSEKKERVRLNRRVR